MIPDPLPLGLADVSRETLVALDRYAVLLAQWTPRINLVAASTLAFVWQRHFADSAQLLPLATSEATSWIDLGSGAGFPGLVVALIARDLRPDLAVTLVESDQRKAAFMAAVARETGVKVRILPQRIEALPPTPHDVVSARALAPLPRLLELAVPLLSARGVCLFPKGARADSELTAAAERWHSSIREVPSLTDTEARILCITEVRPLVPRP